MKKAIIGIVVLLFLFGAAGCQDAKNAPDGEVDTASVTSSDISQWEESNAAQTTGEQDIPADTEASMPDSVTDENTVAVTEPKDPESGGGNPENSENSGTTVPKENNTPSAMELQKIGNLQYYLYTPSNPESNMPLIIYLHGGTNKKADVTALLTTDGFPKYLYDGYYGDLRAYVAIPKLNNGYQGWADIYDQIRELIKTVHTNYAVDMNKISLTGHSMGGTGTYQLQVKLPNTFACIAPMSGSISNNEANVAALRKTKVWAFVGTEDTVVDPDSGRAIIKALNAKGATAKITELEGATHFDVPSLAYKNHDLIQWLVNCGES